MAGEPSLLGTAVGAGCAESVGNSGGRMAWGPVCIGVGAMPIPAGGMADCSQAASDKGASMVSNVTYFMAAGSSSPIARLGDARSRNSGLQLAAARGREEADRVGEIGFRHACVAAFGRLAANAIQRMAVERRITLAYARSAGRLVTLLWGSVHAG